MKNKLAKVAVILFLLTMSLAGTAFAQNAIVGVNPGNKFEYSYNITWTSTDPNALVPTVDIDLNNTEFVRIGIVNVTGTLINADFTRQYKNGTATKQNGNIDVNSQILEIPYSVLIIRAFANTNEKIYPDGGYPTLNETEFRTYTTGRVETIRYVSSMGSETNNQTTEIFFDRARGVGLEYHFETVETSGSTVNTTKVTMEITSMAIPEFPSIVLLLVPAIALGIIAIAAKKNLSNQHKQTP
jgi:hypothetical protein